MPKPPDPVADFLLSMAHPKRRGVIQLTASEPWCVTDLAAELGMQQPTLTRHLGEMEALGLIRRERQGQVVGVWAQVAEVERMLAEAIKAIHPFGATALSFRSGPDGEERKWT